METEHTNNRKEFKGFYVPNSTQVPDTLFDELLSELSGAELKVVLYIIRRTFGFKRQTDTISISQLLHGITKKIGQALVQKSDIQGTVIQNTDTNVNVDKEGGGEARESKTVLHDLPTLDQP